MIVAVIASGPTMLCYLELRVDNDCSLLEDEYFYNGIDVDNPDPKIKCIDPNDYHCIDSCQNKVKITNLDIAVTNEVFPDII